MVCVSYRYALAEYFMEGIWLNQIGMVFDEIEWGS